MGGQACAAVRVDRDAHDIAALRTAAVHVRADALDAIDRRRLVAHARHVVEDVLHASYVYFWQLLRTFLFFAQVLYLASGQGDHLPETSL